MKTKITIVLAIIIFLSSCNTQYYEGDAGSKINSEETASSSTIPSEELQVSTNNLIMPEKTVDGHPIVQVEIDGSNKYFVSFNQTGELTECCYKLPEGINYDEISGYQILTNTSTIYIFSQANLLLIGKGDDVERYQKIDFLRGELVAQEGITFSYVYGLSPVYFIQDNESITFFSQHSPPYANPELRTNLVTLNLSTDKITKNSINDYEFQLGSVVAKDSILYALYYSPTTWKDYRIMTFSLKDSQLISESEEVHFDDSELSAVDIELCIEGDILLGKYTESGEEKQIEIMQIIK